MDSQRKRSTLQRLSAVWPMNDSHEGPVPPAVGRSCLDSTRYTIFLILVNVDSECLRDDDASNARAAESRVTRFQFDNPPDQRLVRPFRSGLPRARGGREQPAVFSTHQGLMKREERRGT